MEVVNTCADKNGGCDQKCRHGPGGPICSCHSGYELDADEKNCNDIDECQRGLSQCKQDCNNSPGGYSCACRLGYTLDRDGITCNDNDECSVNNGGCDHTCENIPGSFRCLCTEGYKLMADKKSCDVVPPRQAVLIATSHSRSDTPPHQNSPRLRYQVTPPTVVPLLDEEFRQYLALEGLDVSHCKTS
ncbi:multiple epidermal growth factor-like domains protein 6 [Caerostris extrusa]|uniref:Multiple epidermal growth factor-like domains protein 6 n=1 Tax=Caerostris extrusa TaxID=172846 RepID=A0AAV4QGQ9_CAEEX|nr:multiple epidermal growth factor-like domains protein 6 [Caerostris extrusa]